MDLIPYMKQLRIDVIGNTVFINSKLFEFCYTPANDAVKDEFKDQYRYFGGLQSEFRDDSEDYKKLENKLCDIADAVLAALSVKKLKEPVPIPVKAEKCKDGCLYSRSINQVYPRQCIKCGHPEPERKPADEDKLSHS
jgi:hypothetical protein